MLEEIYLSSRVKEKEAIEMVKERLVQLLLVKTCIHLLS